MAKRLFLLFISSFIGIIMNPGFLAADQIAKVGLPDFDAVETTPVVTEVINTEVAQAQIVATQSVATSQTAAARQATPVVQATAVKQVSTPNMPLNYISIANRTIEIRDVASIVESGNIVNHYTGSGGKFYYGHNSANVFGGLVNLGVGNVFSITRNGVTTRYRVARRVIYQKNVAEGTIELGDGQNHMGSVAKACYKVPGASRCSEQYSISLMTCHGRALGGGDATERLVLFANQF